jgi:hypothetical protein
MTYESNVCIDDVVRANQELATKLQQSEFENASLKSAIEQFEYRVLTLSEKLDDANNEIGRLGMVLQHRAKDMQTVRQLGKNNEWLYAASQHH